MPANKPPAAVIFGCSGPVLTDAEKRFFAESDPYGFILFARNIEQPEQVRRLVDDLRQSVGRYAPILIDQEGGRVQRLRPPYWPARPPMALFGRMAAVDLPLARRAAGLNARLIAEDLMDLGIDVDCAPLLDVPVAGADAIIGDRAFNDDPMLIADLGRAVMQGLLDGGVMPIVKHIPGHGRAMVDSHKGLPVVDSDRATLEATDFVPFRALRDAPWAMTAHVVYSAFDDRAPATMSRLVIDQVIRGFIGCDAVLLSDDLSMHALSGRFEDRAALSLAAGCDLVLHCNGDDAEMRAVAAGVTPLRDISEERLARADIRKQARPLAENAAQLLAQWLKDFE